LGGLTVHYEESGSGQLVVLLHGWGANLTLFRPLAELIARRYHVVGLDFPGCGGTSEPPTPWGMDEYTAFTAEFIADYGVDDVIVLGHSHGGRVAIRLATETGLGFAVRQMILVDSAGRVPQRDWRYKLRLRTYKAGKAILGSAPARAVAPNGLGRLQKAMGSTDYAAASPVMRASLVKVVNTDLMDLLGQITAETLLIWGENDTATPPDDGRAMERAIPGAGLVILPGAGHYSFLDQPYAFGKVIESFLKIG